MSKFKVNTTKFEKTSIFYQDMDRLFELLVSKIPKLDKTVNKSILKMKQTGHKYRLLTFGKDYVVVIRKSARAKSCVVEFFNIRGINRFRNILSILRQQLNTQSLYYVDLYRFLGDSFLSTYMLDVFIKDFNITQPYVLSRAAKHINGFYKAHDLTYWANVADNSIYVISDLLDKDDAWLQDILTIQGKDRFHVCN